MCSYYHLYLRIQNCMCALAGVVGAWSWLGAGWEMGMKAVHRARRFGGVYADCVPVDLIVSSCLYYRSAMPIVYPINYVESCNILVQPPG